MILILNKIYIALAVAESSGLVILDHEDLSTTHHYSENFEELMTIDKESGNRFIMELNDNNERTTTLDT